MRLQNILTSLLACMLLAACATIGLTPVKSIDDQLAYDYKIHTSLLLMIPSAVNNGSMTKAEGKKLIEISDNARSVLDEAKALKDIDLKTALGKVTLAQGILDSAKKYVNELKPPAVPVKEVQP